MGQGHACKGKAGRGRVKIYMGGRRGRRTSHVHKGRQPRPNLRARVGIGGKSAGPGDVAIAGGIEIILGFAEYPACSDSFFEGEIIGRDVLFGCGLSEESSGGLYRPGT